MIAFASSLDQGGVLGTNAEDCALVLEAMTGFDENDSTSLDLDVPDYSASLDKPLTGRKIGLPKEFFGAGVDRNIATSVEEAIKVYEGLGATTVEVGLPNSEVGMPCYYVLAPAEASSNLSRFDGVRYGHRAEQYEDLNDMYETSRAEGFGAEVKRRIMIGAYVLSSGYYDAYYIKAQKLRRMISNDFSAAFEKCDFILGPTTPATAFGIGEKNDDPVAMYLNDIFTNSANLAGLPAMSLPSGFDSNGLPIGLHLIGRYLDEATILNAAHLYQQQTGWHQRIPGEYE
jgi:aspartyl-tRNA(Asn)/glutamyl-tRNA(Gln) amidotransferase subunit A